MYAFCLDCGAPLTDAADVTDGDELCYCAACLVDRAEEEAAEDREQERERREREVGGRG